MRLQKTANFLMFLRGRELVLTISDIEYCRYLDPEYFLRRQLTTASDVYAFGVCLLELITGQQSIDHMRLEEYNLVEWVSSHIDHTSSINAEPQNRNHKY